jgi:DNA transformation protein and related proteins
MNKSQYVDYILDLLSQFGSIRARRMFSGYGIYKDDIFFALIVNDNVYFKISESDRSTYKSFGSQPLSFTKKNGQLITMNYWQVPIDILENQKKLTTLVENSLRAAKQQSKPQKK